MIRNRKLLQLSDKRFSESRLRIAGGKALVGSVQIIHRYIQPNQRNHQHSVKKHIADGIGIARRNIIDDIGCHNGQHPDTDMLQKKANNRHKKLMVVSFVQG